MNALLKFTPEQFCNATYTCENGKKYALTQPNMAMVWHNCPRANWLLWIADTVDCMPDDKTLRSFAVWCVRETPLKDGRKVFDLLTDDRSKNALVIAEQYAMGNATQQELFAARVAARNAAGNARAARATANAALLAWYVSWIAADDARYVPLDAALDAEYVEWDAANMHQANHLRTLIQNPFKEDSK
jgi:hypothetical protein